jgi:hypothetical protein
MVDELYPRPPGAWSILEGNIDEGTVFPDQTAVDIALKNSLVWQHDPTMAARVYQTDLLLYALEECNAQALADPGIRRRIGREVAEAIEASMHLAEPDRKESLKRLTDDTFTPTEVPIMVLVRRLQEAGIINSSQRSVLDAAIRVLYIKQSK